MTGDIAVRVEDYITLRRGLGYRSAGPERYLRNFADYVDDQGHHGPIPLEVSMAWAAKTNSADPCNPARRLSVIRGFLRHLSGLDNATAVPAPGLLGPTGHRKPPHVYSDEEIGALLTAAGGLAPFDGLRQHSYRTLFGLLACTGLRISEARLCSRSAVRGEGGALTCWLVLGGGRVGALAGVLSWAGGSAHPHREDVLGRPGGADRVLPSPRCAADRAHRVRP